ncbi:MAG TPA: hypothetical protein GXZ20_03190 [Halanaerobiaceae bacterium]|jgi:hypothetical protein|nr:general stress protein [Bacillota bacterium]HHU92131.1 hypothetical protein [Halanaerobiaceae bacterium]HOA41708.1 general stress protein [Halanaerobiales bacterium]HPZ63709.1 general stress protein [Halanaerobiales bacterium]HQD04977.1 general stress protein [Halanaerobiales bacterium]
MSTVIGVFDDKESAESALREIEDLGFTEEEISLIAKDDGEDSPYMDQNLADGAATGGAIGGLAGIAASLGALTIPGIGPILAAGPIAAGLTGVAAGGIAGSLVDMGIPRERGDYYENEVKSGKILAAVDLMDADEDEIEDIASIFRDNGANDVEIH